MRTYEDGAMKCLECKPGQEILENFHVVMSTLKSIKYGKKNFEELTKEERHKMGKVIQFIENTKACNENLSEEYIRQEMEYYLREIPQETLESMSDENSCLKYIRMIILSMENFFVSEPAEVYTEYRIFDYKKNTVNYFMRMCDSYKGNETNNVAALKKHIKSIRGLDFGGNDSASDSVSWKELFAKVTKNKKNEEKIELSKKDFLNLHRLAMRAFEGFLTGEKEEYTYQFRFDCESGMLYDFIANEKEYVAFINRVSKLNDSSRHIIMEFFSRLPTHFGENLSRLMGFKDYESNDLFRLLKGTYVNTQSAVDGWINNEKAPLNKEVKGALCRALLVDEEVLDTGKGNSFGNWMVYLKDPQMLEEEIKFAKKDEEFPDIILAANKNKAKAANPELSDRMIKDYMYSCINKEIQRKFTAKELVADFAGEKKDSVFPEKEIDLYPDKKDRFFHIPDKTPLYILLDVLEKCN